MGFLARVPGSTLSRLWQDESWLDGVSGATLQRLITAIPSLLAYVDGRSHAARIDSVLTECADSGLEVRFDRLETLIARGQPVQHLVTALEATASVMRLDSRTAIASLARCWGSGQSIALDAVIAPDHGVLAAPDLLVDKALQLIGVVDTGCNSLRTTVGYGILVHKATKLTGAVPAEVSNTAADRSAAFAYRSSVIGMLLHSDDPDAAFAYQRQLDARPLLRRNELWSLATFCGDEPQTPEFALTAKQLNRTAAEMIRDLSALNDAYLHYLVTTAIPAVLDYDPTFGSLQAELRTAVEQRLEHGVADARVRAATVALRKSIR
ncbi:MULTISPECIES: hypothetical protein [unclassified Nocardia]|uniref:hypothetical protein n=1 Tax=unclassified Nocardia TaxID=2637762 RepID=UPI00278C5FD1|nr:MULTISPECIES: hypothetical protein [unclassified Nocardia]